MIEIPYNIVTAWGTICTIVHSSTVHYIHTLYVHAIIMVLLITHTYSLQSLRDSFNNFNSYLAVLSAIESASVTRLDWSDKILKALEEPRQLIDNRGSFKNYREAFSQAKPPCIPYM